MKLNIKQDIFLKYTSAFFFLFLFLNDHTFYSDFFGSTSKYFLTISTFFLILTLFIARKIYTNGKMWMYFLGWTVAVFVPCLVSGITSLVFVRFCYWTVLLLMLLVLEKADIDYRESLFFVTKIFCVWCFICYLYTLLEFDFLPVTNVSGKLLYNWFNVELNGYFIYKNLVKFSLGGLSIIKLYSPLGEPGIACMYFNFAIIWLLFFTDTNHKNNRKWIILFSSAIILSLSMIGIIVFFSILITYLYKKNKIKLALLLVIPIIILSLILIIQKLSTESFIQRTSDYVLMSSVIIDSFPFGIGLGNIDSIQPSMLGIDVELVGFYCGLLYPLAQYGVLGIYYYYMLFIAFKNFSNNTFGRYAFLIYFFLTLLTQPQAEECFILSFIFAGIIRHCRRRVKTMVAL